MLDRISYGVYGKSDYEMDIALWVDQPDGQGWDEEGNDGLERNKSRLITERENNAQSQVYWCYWCQPWLEDKDRNQII